MNRSLAKIISFAGHPLWVLTYILLFLLVLNPFAFGVRDLSDPRAMILLLSVFITSMVLPGIGVLLMKPLGLINNLKMRDKQERIGPYIVCGVFYLWLFKNLLSTGLAPQLFAQFVLGASIALFLAFFINIFSNISIHAVGMGNLFAMVLMTFFQWGSLPLALWMGPNALLLSPVLVLCVVLALAGSVGVARLALHAHRPADVYKGYLAGMASVWVASHFL
jgi:hypothetical protein